MENNLNSQDISKDTADKRQEKVQNFQLNLQLDEDYPEIVATPQTDNTSAVEIPTESKEAEIAPEEAEEEDFQIASHARPKKNSGCLKRILYGTIVMALSIVIAYFLIIFMIDAVALNRSDKPIDIEIPGGASTEQIANILKENGVIESPFCFRLFSKFTGSDGKYQMGAFTVTADMGYSVLVDELQTMTPRETVTVTIPEGYTVEDIAKLLEEKNVCEKETFYEAVVSDQYDYDFVKAIPTADDGDQYKGRIYLLEGYLFPDTYNFYVGSSGETVVNRMLENFNTKLTAELRAEISAQGLTIDEAIILASIVQGEAAKKDDMFGVSRVLQNRSTPGSGYAKIQCDSTGDYVRGILPSIGGIEVTSIAYDTYQREGLPVGAINNPGVDAIKAALYPSDKSEHKKAYFFATDYDTGITYFSTTYAQHEYVCRRYGIGMYG